MAEKLTRLQKMKAKNPKRFAEYMALKKRTGRTSRDVARKTRDKISARGGTPAEARALRAGEKAAKAALKAGATVKQADAICEKTSRGKMKTNRSKTGAEVAWTLAGALPLGIGQTARGIQAAYKGSQAVKKLVSDKVKKEAAEKAAKTTKKKAAAAVKKTKAVKGFLPQSQKVKKVNRAAATAEAKRKAAETAKEKATAKVTAGQKAVKATNKKVRDARKAAKQAGDVPLGLRLMGSMGSIIARADQKDVKPKAAKPLPAKPKPKKVAAKPKPKKSPVKRTPAPVTKGDEERVGSSSPGKTITSNPKGEGSSTGLDLETILERIEEMEYPTDPDDPGAFDLDDLKADLKELRGYKHGGKVKRNMGGSVRGVGAAKRGFGRATYSDKLY